MAIELLPLAKSALTAYRDQLDMAIDKLQSNPDQALSDINAATRVYQSDGQPYVRLLAANYNRMRSRVTTVTP